MFFVNSFFLLVYTHVYIMYAEIKNTHERTVYTEGARHGKSDPK